MCNLERYFVVGDNRKGSLNRLLANPSGGKGTAAEMSSPSVLEAAHLLGIAHNNTDHMDAIKISPGKDMEKEA